MKARMREDSKRNDNLTIYVACCYSASCDPSNYNFDGAVILAGNVVFGAEASRLRDRSRGAVQSYNKLWWHQDVGVLAGDYAAAQLCNVLSLVTSRVRLPSWCGLRIS